MSFFEYDVLSQVGKEGGDLPQGMEICGKDWKLFQFLFPHMGAFYYEAGSQTAYFDDNCYRILRMEKESGVGVVPRGQFFKIIQELTRTPLTNRSHIYRYSAGDENRWLRLTMAPWGAENCWLGFIQDTTSSGVDYALNPRERAIELDPLTRLPVRDAFVHALEKRLEQDTLGCMVVFHVHGIDHLSRSLGYEQGDRCLAAVAGVLARFRAERVLIGVKAYKEFYLYVSDIEVEEMRRYLAAVENAISVCTITDEFGFVMQQEEGLSLTVSAGICQFPKQGKNIGELIDRANFALFEAASGGEQFNLFSDDRFIKEQQNWQEMQQLKRVLEGNLLSYDFQPIISAKTGEIYAYEALMRTRDRKLKPSRLLELSEQQGCLCAVERLTLTNTLNIISKRQEVFIDRKLFVNILPGHMLADEEYDRLVSTYGELMQKLVIEVTEHAPMDGQTLRTIQERCKAAGCEFVIDDYGSGYSNTGSLLLCMPSLVKVDRELLSGIENDAKKRHLFSDLVNFCHENGIEILAEGIETSQEMRTVIQLGADYLQGYYISRPKPVFLLEVAPSVKEEIIHVNLNACKSIERKLYTAEEAVVNITELALQQYTDLKVCSSEMTLLGDSAHAAHFSVQIADGLDCTLRLRNVNLDGTNRPAIVLGENSRFTIVVEGENYLSYCGIQVPETSALLLTGDGVLHIDANSVGSFGIGSDFEHSFGQIMLQMQGRLRLFVNGEQCVGIGGGINPAKSQISLRGAVSMTLTGISCLGVGSFSGGARVLMDRCELSMEMAAASCVGVGAMEGKALLHLRESSLEFRGSGSRAFGIGVLSGGDLRAKIWHSDVRVILNGRYVTCIGTTSGAYELELAHTALCCTCEGSELVGIGDPRGDGNISLADCDLKFSLLAPVVTEICGTGQE